MCWQRLEALGLTLLGLRLTLCVILLRFALSSTAVPEQRDVFHKRRVLGLASKVAFGYDGQTPRLTSTIRRTMYDNLRFYLASIVAGFLVSLCWWHEEKEKIGFPWLVVIVPIIWIVVASSIIAFVKNESLSFLEAIPKSVDVRYFYRGYGMVELRDSGVLAMFSTATIALFFRWIWNLTNRVDQRLPILDRTGANQDSAHNGNKRRV